MLSFNEDDDDWLQLKKNTDRFMAAKILNTAFVQFIFIIKSFSFYLVCMLFNYPARSCSVRSGHQNVEISFQLLDVADSMTASHTVCVSRASLNVGAQGSPVSRLFKKSAAW